MRTTPLTRHELKTARTLHDIRLFIGLSQKDFGARMGLSRDSISNLELGRAPVTPVKAVAVTRALHLLQEDIHYAVKKWSAHAMTLMPRGGAR